MHVHLALPGLLWPARALSDVMFDLDLPALSWLLGRARPHRVTRAAPLAFEDWLVARFGYAAEAKAGAAAAADIASANAATTNAVPAAALRLLGEDGAPAPGNAHWLCADPAHLAFEHGHPTLGDPTRLGLITDEITELAASLTPTFADIGKFSLRPSGRGYIELAQPAAIAATPPSAAIGRGAADLMPRGADAARWRRIANEAQIVLHDLDLNRRRKAAGLPTVNTLWFWGAGALPGTQPPAYQKVGGGDTLARGCASHAGVHWQPAADMVSDGARDIAFGSGMLLIEDRLVAPAQQLDAYAWREALLAVERERLAPLVAALRGGRLRRLTLTALGDAGIVDIDLVRGDALRFWRRPRKLTDIITT